MADRGYWSWVAGSRLSRRRAIGGAAAVGAGALALSTVGCGGGDAGPRQPVDSSGLLSFPEDTTARAKPGGTLKDVINTDVVSFDPLSSSSFNTQAFVAYFTYPRLLKWTMAKYPNNATGASEGDLAESFELSSDKLQLTFKLRPGLKWENRAPTNGREIDAQDVVFSWNKFARVSPFRADIAYSEQNPSSPVESVSAPDSRTVIVRLKQPDASIVPLFTTAILFFVMPRESEGGFDARGEVRGYGPWLLEEYRPSVMHAWRKNPNYYVKDRPLIDRWENPIVQEYATRLSQFRAGNIWFTVATQDDVVQTKKDISALLLRQSDTFATTPSFIGFGFEGNSPFRDERVRQAASMLIDRELMTDVIANRPKFVAEGLPVSARYHTMVGAGWDGYWLDPQDDKKFGPNAKYLQYNVAEAKKLLEAAGFRNGFDTPFIYNQGTQYGAAYHRVADILAGMWPEGGIRARQDPKDYQTDFLPNYYYGYAQPAWPGRTPPGWSGIGYFAERGYPTVASQIFATMHKDGARFHGATLDGRNAHLGDPQVNSMIDKIRQEFDLKKQQELVQDFVRYVTGKSYWIPYPTTTLTFQSYWPCIGNLAYFRTYAGGNFVAETRLNYWVDDTKPPFRSA